MRRDFLGVLMSVAGGRLALPHSIAPMWVIAFSMMLYQGTARSALPPAASEPEVRKADSQAGSKPP